MSDDGEWFSGIGTVIVVITTSNEGNLHIIEMRIVPSKEKSIRKQSAAKKGIMDLLKNARTIRHRNIKKPQRIKPRYGIYDSLAWARVKRNPIPPPIVDIAQTQAPPKPLTERVKARHDGNLDFLLENQSEKNSKRIRPAESYINSAVNIQNDEYLSQRTEISVPLNEQSNPEQSDGKNDIMDLVKNARPNRHRSIKKQPRVKPRYGIFGSSVWARVKRGPIPPPIVGVAQSKTVATPFNECSKVRIDDTLDLLLQIQTEKNSKRKDEYENLLQQTECIEAEANVVVGSQTEDSQYSVFGGNQFQKSPSVIDRTTQLANGDPILTPFSEFSGIMNSMDFKVANVFDKEPIANFDTPTPSEANAFGKHFNDIDNTARYTATLDANQDYLSGQTSDALHYNEIEFDELSAAAQFRIPNQIELSGNSPIVNISGWSAYQLGFDDYYSDTGKSMANHYTPFCRYGEVPCPWTPDVVNYDTAPRHQPLSEQLCERIRSKISENMLEVIRSVKNCLFPPVCDDPLNRSCVEYGTEWQSDVRQTVGENRPMVSYQSTQAPSTAYSENCAATTTFQQIFNNSFFRNNNVTIMQTCTTTRIIRSSAANNFSKELGFYEFDDDDYQF